VFARWVVVRLDHGYVISISVVDRPTFHTSPHPFNEFPVINSMKFSDERHDTSDDWVKRFAVTSSCGDHLSLFSLFSLSLLSLSGGLGPGTRHSEALTFLSSSSAFARKSCDQWGGGHAWDPLIPSPSLRSDPGTPHLPLPASDCLVSLRIGTYIFFSLHSIHR